ncbi:porin family protein [Croceicoccus ponticola]|uniref:Porin family protein n=1 Tax=Croceicoccus ponticola TaxID=2217664 RepID=A0A437GZY8_9SPHN|nr:outer membrane beta-barrel protein [Croceicoccus ponticola]RVQ68904.1 porin family protein [Croceicoccus ponticola]
MKKIVALLVAGTAFGAIAMPAAAQNMQGGNFSGPRVEAIIGYDASQAGSTSDNELNDQDDQDIDGLLYGVGIGYDMDMGGLVLGIEGEYTDSTAKTEFSDGGDYEGFGLGRVDTGRDLYVGARLGAKVAPDLLAYVKGGYTNTKFNVLATDGETELEQDINTDGWRAGAGLEYAMSDNMFTKIEYRYSTYKEGEFENGEMTDSERFDIDTDRHQVVASIGMRF